MMFFVWLLCLASIYTMRTCRWFDGMGHLFRHGHAQTLRKETVFTLPDFGASQQEIPTGAVLGKDFECCQWKETDIL